MTTNTLTSTGTETITGFLPSIYSDEFQESQEILVPECIDAVMAEFNPRAAEQLGRNESQTSRVPPLQDTYRSNLGFTKLPFAHRYNPIGQR